MSLPDGRLPLLLRARLVPDELAPGDLVLLDAAVAHRPPPPGIAAVPGAFVDRAGGTPGAGTHEAGAHGAACACCGGRSPIARTLGALAVARARGDVPFFTRLVAVSDIAGRAAARAAARADPLVASRYVLV